MAYLTPEQTAIIVLLVGIPISIFLVIAIAWAVRNMKGWAGNLFDWLSARKIGLAVFLLIFMVGIGLFLFSYWTDNIALTVIVMYILLFALVFLALYLMIPRRIPGRLRSARAAKSHTPMCYV